MEGQSSLRKQAKFSRRILSSSRRILRSPMPNEKPAGCRHILFLPDLTFFGIREGYFHALKFLAFLRELW